MKLFYSSLITFLLLSPLSGAQSISQMRERIMSDRFEEIRSLSTTIEQLLEIVESDNLDSKLKALAIVETDEPREVIKMAVKIRRSMDSNVDFLMSSEGFQQMKVLRKKLSVERARVLQRIEDMRANVLNVDDQFAVQVSNLALLADYRWSVEGSWQKALTMMTPIRMKASLSEDELKLAITAYQKLLSKMLLGQELWRTEIEVLKSALKEHDRTKLRVAIRKWALGVKIQLNPVFQATTQSAGESLLAAIEGKEELDAILDAKIKEFEAENEKIWEDIHQIADSLASAAKSHPDEVEKLLKEKVR